MTMDWVDFTPESDEAREAIYELLVSSLDQTLRLALDQRREANARAISALCARVAYLAEAAERIGGWTPVHDVGSSRDAGAPSGASAN